MRWKKGLRGGGSKVEGGSKCRKMGLKLMKNLSEVWRIRRNFVTLPMKCKDMMSQQIRNEFVCFALDYSYLCSM